MPELVHKSIIGATTSRGVVIFPRIIRLRDAADYLGMDKNRFNKEVRPFLTEIPIGNHGIGFDRLDLDSWVDDYKSRIGRSKSKGEKTWDKQEPELEEFIAKVTAVKPSAKLGKVSEFLPALEKSARNRPKAGCISKSKEGSVNLSVEKALAICLQSVRRAT